MWYGKCFGLAWLDGSQPGLGVVVHVKICVQLCVKGKSRIRKPPTPLLGTIPLGYENVQSRKEKDNPRYRRGRWAGYFPSPKLQGSSSPGLYLHEHLHVSALGPPCFSADMSSCCSLVQEIGCSTVCTQHVHTDEQPIVQEQCTITYNRWWCQEIIFVQAPSSPSHITHCPSARLCAVHVLHQRPHP